MPEDVKEVIFEMSADSAPGPDGYSANFFKEAWSIIGDNLYAAIRHIFFSGELPMDFNSNFIVLIPKVEQVIKVEQFPTYHVEQLHF